MDHTLNAHVKLDTASDVVWIDVRGRLTQASRTALLETVERVRQMGISSHVRVDLGHAEFVESSALAGLRNELNSTDHGAARIDAEEPSPAAGGVSLELNPHPDDPNAVLMKSLDLSSVIPEPVSASEAGPLTRFSDDALLAASDSVFGMMDDPSVMASSELLASYDAIALEISRREDGRQPEPV
jgi:hypothetical protein